MASDKPTDEAMRASDAITITNGPARSIGVESRALVIDDRTHLPELLAVAEAARLFFNGDVCDLAGALAALDAARERDNTKETT